MHLQFKKTATVLVAVFLLMGLALPVTAHAFSFSCLFDIGECVVVGIAKLIVAIIATPPALIFFVVAGITNWLITIVINIPVVPGVVGTPAFVTTGFELTRQIANMFFLLILVFIGLATILRLQEYQLQRTLPKLILIALLVNFSSLLVGFVVDVANIATNFFLHLVGVGFNLKVFTDIFTSGNAQVDAIFNGPGSNMEQFAGAIAFGVVLSLFFLFASFAYIAIANIFFLRLVILWTLIILAPLAFLAFILPGTKKWWDQWLSALIQWSFLAVPIAFFIWLSNQILLHPVAQFTAGPALPLSASNFQDLITMIISPVASLVLLSIGMAISVSIGPSIVGKAANTGKKFATIGAGAFGGLVAHSLIQNNLAKSAKVQGLARRMENFSSNRTGITGTLLRAGSAPTRWAGRRIGSGTQAGLKRDVAKAEAEAKDWSSEETASKLSGNLSFDKRLGILNARAKAGKIDDDIEAGVNEDAIEEVYNRARQIGQHQDLQAAFPHLVTDQELQQSRFLRDYNEQHPGAHITRNQVTAAQAGTVTPEEITQERDRMYRRMDPAKVKNMSRGVLATNRATGAFQHPDAVESVIRNFNGTRVGTLASSDQGQEAIPPLERQIRDLFTAFQSTTDPAILNALTRPGAPRPPTTPLQWLAFQPQQPPPPATPLTPTQLRIMGGNNPPLARWIQTQGGRGLGFNLT